MRTFRAMEQDWHIEANYGSLRRVKNDTGVDLTKFIAPEDDTHSRLVSDPFLMMEVVCSFVAPQLEQRRITAEQLLNSLDEESGDATFRATSRPAPTIAAAAEQATP